MIVRSPALLNEVMQNSYMMSKEIKLDFWYHVTKTSELGSFVLAAVNLLSLSYSSGVDASFLWRQFLLWTASFVSVTGSASLFFSISLNKQQHIYSIMSNLGFLAYLFVSFCWVRKTNQKANEQTNKQLEVASLFSLFLSSSSSSSSSSLAPVSCGVRFICFTVTASALLFCVRHASLSVGVMLQSICPFLRLRLFASVFTVVHLFSLTCPVCSGFQFHPYLACLFCLSMWGFNFTRILLVFPARFAFCFHPYCSSFLWRFSLFPSPFAFCRIMLICLSVHLSVCPPVRLVFLFVRLTVCVFSGRDGALHPASRDLLREQVERL